MTPERVEAVRRATEVVEAKLSGFGAFQYLAILHEDRVTGIRDGGASSGNRSRYAVGIASMRARPHPPEYRLTFWSNLVGRSSPRCPVW